MSRRMLTWFINTKKIARPRSKSTPSMRPEARDAIEVMVHYVVATARPLGAVSDWSPGNTRLTETFGPSPISRITRQVKFDLDF